MQTPSTAAAVQDRGRQASSTQVQPQGCFPAEQRWWDLVPQTAPELEQGRVCCFLTVYTRLHQGH